MFKFSNKDILSLIVIGCFSGVLWIGVNAIYGFLNFFSFTGLNALLDGFWILPAIFARLYVNKFGSALIVEIIASFIEALTGFWGVISLLYGFLQGFVSDIGFVIAYKLRFSKRITCVFVSLLVAMSNFILTFYLYKYYLLLKSRVLLEFSLHLLSAFFIAGLFSYTLYKYVKN